MKNYTKASVWTGIAAIALLASDTGAAPLAQRHPYQKTLREYFATLTGMALT